MAPSRGSGPKKHARTSSASKSQPRGSTSNTSRQPLGSETGLREADRQSSSRHLQQQLLSAFAHAFSDLLAPNAVNETLKPLLQQIKQHLYNRDFAAAFASENLLAAYAVRWSPSRALGYMPIFKECLQHLPQLVDDELSSEAPKTVERPRESGANGGGTLQRLPKRLQVTCLGGGAGAELVALAGLHSLTSSSMTLSTSDDDLSHIHLTSIDIAAYATVNDRLLSSLTTVPTLSPHASATARASAAAVVPPSALTALFTQLDVLDPASSDALEQQVKASDITTLMFTLNELYSTDRAQTQRLLLDITRWTEGSSGKLLLVVDSPGSYSEVGLGAAASTEKAPPTADETNESIGQATTTHQEASSTSPSDSKKHVHFADEEDELAEREKKKRRYPMRWLLDHALLTQARSSMLTAGRPRSDADDDGPWEKLVDDEARWFRLPEGLQYPIDLENMRFQMHLYRRR